jgi:hypothetical protein
MGVLGGNREEPTRGLHEGEAAIITHSNCHLLDQYCRHTLERRIALAKRRQPRVGVSKLALSAGEALCLCQ